MPHRLSVAKKLIDVTVNQAESTNTAAAANASALIDQTGRQRAAVADLDWILEKAPDGVDLDRVREMREVFSR